MRCHSVEIPCLHEPNMTERGPALYSKQPHLLRLGVVGQPHGILASVCFRINCCLFIDKQLFCSYGYIWAYLGFHAINFHTNHRLRAHITTPGTYNNRHIRHQSVNQWVRPLLVLLLHWIRWEHSANAVVTWLPNDHKIVAKIKSQDSWGHHGAHVGPINLAIRGVYLVVVLLQH